MRLVHTMVLGLGLIVVGLTARTAMAEAYIVKDGTPQAQIVIAENPTRTVKLAAEESKLHDARKQSVCFIWNRSAA